MSDIQGLLEPISQDAPHGADPRNPARTRELTDLGLALQSARKAEEAGTPDAALWEAAAEAAAAVLSGKSKDMEAAAGWAEARANCAGFEGVLEGGVLVAALAETFWDGLYPSPSPDNKNETPSAARVAPLRLLVTQPSRLLSAIRRAPLFIGADDQLSFAACLKLQQTSQMREHAAAWPAAMKGLRDRHDAFVPGAFEALKGAQEVWGAVQTTIGTLAPGMAFSCGEVSRLLGEIHTFALPFVRVTAETPAPESSGPSQAGAGALAPLPQLRPDSQQRQEALRQLAALAAYFHQAEPHSPVGLILEEALRRAQMSWTDWLVEVVKDPKQRQSILSTLGLPENLTTAQPGL